MYFFILLHISNFFKYSELKKLKIKIKNTKKKLKK